MRADTEKDSGKSDMQELTNALVVLAQQVSGPAGKAGSNRARRDTQSAANHFGERLEKKMEAMLEARVPTPQKTLFGMSVPEAVKIVGAAVVAFSTAFLGMKSAIGDNTAKIEHTNAILFEIRDELRATTMNNGTRLESLDRQIYEDDIRIKETEERLASIIEDMKPRWKRKRK